jgi:ERCC4-type nuclease
LAGPAVADRHAGTARDAEEGRLMSDADRTLAVAVAYEWAIDVFESMDREEALDYLRRVAARQRESYEREIQVDDQQLTHAAEATWVA